MFKKVIEATATGIFLCKIKMTDPLTIDNVSVRITAFPSTIQHPVMSITE